MKTLYLECNMGIAGDMLMAALWQLIPDSDKERVKSKIDSIGLPDTEIQFNKTLHKGISGIHATVICRGEIEGESKVSHNHARNLNSVNEIISNLNIPDDVKSKSINVYNIIADAESMVHGVDIQSIHFHEVGTLDAIADIVVCTYLLNLLKIDRIIASPINVGSGTVKCTHGILPVPAPATVEILMGIPYYSSEIDGELCTPTGAALIKANVDDFSTMPEMVCAKAGYGFGTKEFDVANCVRAFLGETNEDVIELACNIDDMTAEDLAYACEILMNNKALDVTQTPITMKKSRLGTMLSVICKVNDKEDLLHLIFKHTTTIGVREYRLNRYTLDRKISKINTPFGEVRSKKSNGFGVSKEKAEYEDLKEIAQKNNLSIDDVRKLI